LRISPVRDVSAATVVAIHDRQGSRHRRGERIVTLRNAIGSARTR
jgi:hypothetical protein